MDARAPPSRDGGQARRPRGGGGGRRDSTPRSASGVAPPLRALPPRAAPARLHVFDFDQTLVDTPLPDAGAAQWLAATGAPWPHAGWWGRAESLSPLLYACMRPGPAMDAYHAAAADEAAVVAMLTGRRAHLAAEVRAVLAAHGVSALHAELFNDSRDETVAFKTRALRSLCRRVFAARARRPRVHAGRRKFCMRALKDCSARSALSSAYPQAARDAPRGAHLRGPRAARGACAVMRAR
jgi:hypothetical protein